MARKLTQERIDEIVKRYRPRGWRVRQSKYRWNWESAEADDGVRNGVRVKPRTISVPTLIDADSLFLYLHEVGHVTLGHFQHKLPRHREEFEAERFALHVFRSEGIPVTKKIMKGVRARLNVHIQYDIDHDVPIQHHIARWAKSNGHCSRR
jgi:hypothetical protein